MIELSVATEYGNLKDVVLATVKNYRLTEPINITQEKFYASTPPQLAPLLAEQQAFVQVLTDNHINIHWAEPLPECPFQVNTRDVAAVIHDKIVVGRLKRQLRRDEPRGISPILAKTAGTILQMPETGYLEGGDILVDNRIVYVGLGERTDISGYNFIRDNFGEKCEVVPLKLKEGILHLDVVFNILPNRTCLLFPKALVDTSIDFFRNRFENVVIVSEEEQFDLATNVFCLSPQKVVMDKRNQRMANILRTLGIEVTELEFTHTTRIGGSFRCATLPLFRAEPG